MIGATLFLKLHPWDFILISKASPTEDGTPWPTTPKLGGHSLYVSPLWINVPFQIWGFFPFSEFQIWGPGTSFGGTYVPTNSGETSLFQAWSLAECLSECLKFRGRFLFPAFQNLGEHSVQSLPEMKSKSWNFKISICIYTGNSQLFPITLSLGFHPFSWVLQIGPPYFQIFISESVCFLPHPHPPRSTFGYTVLSLQPPSWCLLNLGGHTFFLSLLISRQWSVVLELCSHRRDFVSSASLFGAPFSFRCSPCQVSAPFVFLPLVNKYLCSAWHFVCFCGLFSVLTSYSLTSWSSLPLGEDLPAHPKGVPVCFLSYIYFIFHLSANKNSLLACSIPGHFWFLSSFGRCSCLLVAVKVVPFLSLSLEVTSSPGLPDSSPVLDLNWKRIPPCISLVIHRSLNPPDGLLLIKILGRRILLFPLLYFLSLEDKTKQKNPPEILSLASSS